jgi:hypothetical protein
MAAKVAGSVALTPYSRLSISLVSATAATNPTAVPNQYERHPLVQHQLEHVGALRAAIMA